MAIRFGGGGSWGAVSQTECRRLAKDPRHPLAYRVHYAALGWANVIGHAEFASGGLSEILGSAAGEPLRASGVSQAIKRAKDLHLIGFSSSARCLVVPHHQFQRNGGTGTRSCRTHNIRV